MERVKDKLNSSLVRCNNIKPLHHMHGMIYGKVELPILRQQNSLRAVIKIHLHDKYKK